MYVCHRRQLLLLKRSATREAFPNMWEVMGEHLTPGDAPLDAAERLVSERLGLQPALHGDLRQEYANVVVDAVAIPRSESRQSRANGGATAGGTGDATGSPVDTGSLLTKAARNIRGRAGGFDYSDRENATVFSFVMTEMETVELHPLQSQVSEGHWFSEAQVRAMVEGTRDGNGRVRDAVTPWLVEHQRLFNLVGEDGQWLCAATRERHYPT